MKRIVVIGGGTGTFTVLSGLKKFTDTIDLSAIVTMADSGGSTGRLRDEFGYLPVGDARMALVALADEALADNQKLRDLFLHRFEKGGRDLAGHNFGNLFLVALTDTLGSEIEAIRFASRLLRTQGTVHPVTTNHVTLTAHYADGVIVEGESHIDEPERGRDQHRITHLETRPSGVITDDARAAIENADLIILGPGDLYTSVLAVCVVGGVKDALFASSAKTLYISNLMSKFGQTTGMSVEDHLREVEKYIERPIDHVLVNNAPLSDELIERYAEEAEHPIRHDGSREVILRELLAEGEIKKSKTDVLRRSLVRHDPDKLAKVIIECL